MRSICIRQSFSLQKKLYCLHIKKENTIKHKRREKEVNGKDAADWVLQSARTTRRLWKHLLVLMFIKAAASIILLLK